MARAKTGRATTLWPPSPPSIIRRRRTNQLRNYAVFYDLFDEVLAAGSVDGTDSTDKKAIREVVDTENRLSVNQALLMNGHTGSYDDPALWHTTLVPGKWVAWNGYAVLWQFETTAASGGPLLGYDTDLAYPVETVFDVSGGEINCKGTGSLHEYDVDTKYRVLAVRRNDSKGYYYLIQTGDGPWKLFWMDDQPIYGN